jgi:hypothetical protein
MRAQQEEKERNELGGKRFLAKELVNPVQDLLRFSPGGVAGWWCGVRGGGWCCLQECGIVLAERIEPALVILLLVGRALDLHYGVFRG